MVPQSHSVDIRYKYVIRYLKIMLCDVYPNMTEIHMNRWICLWFLVCCVLYKIDPVLWWNKLLYISTDVCFCWRQLLLCVSSVWPSLIALWHWQPCRRSLKRSTVAHQTCGASLSCYGSWWLERCHLLTCPTWRSAWRLGGLTAH